MPREASVARSVPGVHAYAERSVTAGEPVHFRVSSDAAYQLSVYRLGADPDSDRLDVKLWDAPPQPPNVQTISPGSYVHVDNGLPATQALSGFSVECWVRPWRTSPWQGLITQHTYPTACGFGLFLADDRLQVYLGDGGAFHGTGLRTGPVVPALRWSHVVLTWNGQQASLYLDGQLQDTWSFAGPLVPGSAPLRLGAYGSVDSAGTPRTGQFLDGDLAMPVLYGRALTAQEIQTRASTRPPTVPSLPGVLACWPLTEERGDTLADVSGHGRTGTLINHASWMIGGPGYDAAAVPRYGAYDPWQDATRGHGLRFASDDLYDCGWSVTQTFTVPENAPPGLYVGRVQVIGGGVYEVPFVVRRPASRPKAPVLVLCATNTWLAYSSPFGGQGPAFSCYLNHAAGQPTFQQGLHMPLSAAGVYSPYSTPGVGYSHLVRAERFLHQWLERNGYAHDMVTDLDLHRDPSLLAGYKVLVINGHSEYWSTRAWQAVDDFLTAGGKVAALSGNSLFWRVSFDPSGTVMECRKYDANQGFGGLLYDAVGALWHSQDFQRGGLLREAGYPGWKLLGLEAAGFVDTQASDFIPFTVSNGNHFLFHTPHTVGVVSGAPLGQAPGGGLPRAVGHEWDARVIRLLDATPPAGAPVPVEPPGITTLATASKTQGVLDYYGRWNNGPSSIIGEIIHWDRPQGGGVFYAGSIGTGWALSADPGLQRLMHNVLHHFDVTFESTAPAAVVTPQGELLLLRRGLHGALQSKRFDGTQWLPSEQGWDGAGHAVVGPPAAVAWGPYVTVLGVGTEGPLQGRWWTGSQWGAGPTAWQDLGGQLAGAPAVVSRAPFGNASGFDVFTRGRDGGIHHKWWDGSQWGPSLAGWVELGGRFTHSPVALNWGAFLTLMAVGTDGRLQAKWWNGTQWGPSATTWQDHGGQLAGPLAIVPRAPAVPSGVDVFALGRDGSLQHQAWNGSQWTPSTTGWTNLGGTFVDGPAAVAWNGGARMTLFAVGVDGQMYTKWWDGAQWLPSSTGWFSLGGSFLGPVTAVSLGTNRLEVFAVGTDRAVWRRGWDGTQWQPPSGWQSLGV